MQMKPLLFFVCIVIAGALVAMSDYALSPSPQAALLLNLAFWISIAQGCVALVAAVEIAEGKWILPVKKGLLAVTPMILLCALLFAFLAPQHEIYHRLKHAPGIWFAKWFFIGRNVALLLISYLLALKYRSESLRESANKGMYGVLYLVIFVISQSMVAFDWIMPLEYPWTSTLLGGFYFVESLYTGIAFAGILCWLLHIQTKSDRPPKEIAQARYDTSLMLFGFSLLWVGQFFSQFIVIWYGNLPEEVMFFTERLSTYSFKAMACIILGLLFFIPFFLMLPQRAKSNSYVLFTISLLVLAGIFIERYFFIAPAAKISHTALILEFGLMAIASVLMLRGTSKPSTLSMRFLHGRLH
jgi:hypothetical protein